MAVCLISRGNKSEVGTERCVREGGGTRERPRGGGRARKPREKEKSGNGGGGGGGGGGRRPWGLRRMAKAKKPRYLLTVAKSMFEVGAGGVGVGGGVA